MDNIRMVSSVVLFIIATYLAVLNWIVFYRRYIKKREGVSSWIPFLAGIFRTCYLLFGLCS